MSRLIARLHARLTLRDRGATAVEYGLMVALIAAIIAATVFALGGNLDTMFNNVNTCVANPNAANCP
jgi:pilus assembly protein Flp/PilA